MDGRADLVHAADRHLKWRALDPLERACCDLRRVPGRLHLDDASRCRGEGRRPSPAVAAGGDVGVLHLRRLHRGLGSDAAQRSPAALGLDGGDERRDAARLFEVMNRAVVMGVGLFLLVYGWQNFLTGFGSFRMPSMLPIAYLYAPIRRAALWGAVQPRTDRQRSAPRLRALSLEGRRLGRCRTARSS